MNPVNFQATHADDGAQALSEEHPKPAPGRAPAAVDNSDEAVPVWRPAMATDGRNKQRAVVSTVVIGIQALLLLGIAAGLAHKPAPIEYKPIEVALIPEKEDKFEEPPPPPPVLQQPQIVMNTITPPLIYTPPPLVEVKNAPPSPITSQSVAPPPRVDPNIAIQAFQMRLLREVNRNLRYPRQARQELLEGIVLVRFTMDRKGNVSNVVIHEPSAFEALNQEGIAVLLRASFPAPPPELKGDAIEMILPVKFSLRAANGPRGPGGRHRGPGGPRGRDHHEGADD